MSRISKPASWISIRSLLWKIKDRDWKVNGTLEELEQNVRNEKVMRFGICDAEYTHSIYSRWDPWL